VSDDPVRLGAVKEVSAAWFIGAYPWQKGVEATVIWESIEQESAMPIDPNNPFGFCYSGTENSGSRLMGAGTTYYRNVAPL
jgi:hypothetical protein